MNIEKFFFYNSNQVISGSYDNDVVFINETNGATIKVLSGHVANVNALKLIKMDLLISVSADNSTIFWNLTTYTKIRQLWLHNNYVADLDTFNGFFSFFFN